MTLYEIERAILEAVDTETGEIINEEMLDSLLMEKEQKIEGIALWIKNLTAEASALKAEKEAFAKRQKVAENKVESLKRYLTNALQGEKFQTTKVSIGFRSSESVEITDITKIPDDYLRYKDPEADKTAIKQMIKDGYQIDGAVLVRKQSIQIK